MPYDYEAARKGYLPVGGVRILFVGESAPSPSADVVRFFYHPELRADNLFRGLMLALYCANGAMLASTPKALWLQRFESDGHYLEDLCTEPINKLPPAQRSLARRGAVQHFVARVRALDPAGIIICHQGTYQDIAVRIRAERLPLLHDKPIPFPLGNYRARFAKAVRLALAKANVPVPCDQLLVE